MFRAGGAADQPGEIIVVANAITGFSFGPDVRVIIPRHGVFPHEGAELSPAHLIEGTANHDFAITLDTSGEDRRRIVGIDPHQPAN